MDKKINFIDLKKQYSLIKKDINIAIQKVLDSGQYLNGQAIIDLEDKLANYSGHKHSIGVASGTDALSMVLIAWGIKPGDAVFVPGFTFIATAEVVALLGATPILIDINKEDYNINLSSLENAIEKTKNDKQLNLKAIISVDLFGLAANHSEINKIALKYNLKHLVDAAQSFGAETGKQKSLSCNEIATTSFYPAKPLGAYGDAGAIFCSNDELKDKLKSIRIHGHGSFNYEHINLGITGRIDTLQAAILLEKLKIFPFELKEKQKVADFYKSSFTGKFKTQQIPNHKKSAWAQYAIEVENRTNFINYCNNKKIPTATHYPMTIAQQPFYKKFPAPDSLPNATDVSKHIVCLPMHPYLTDEELEYITTTILNY